MEVIWHTTHCRSSDGRVVQTLNQRIHWAPLGNLKVICVESKAEFIPFLDCCGLVVWFDVLLTKLNKHILKSAFFTCVPDSKNLHCFVLFRDVWVKLVCFWHFGLPFEHSLRQVFKEFKYFVFANWSVNECWLEKCWQVWSRSWDTRPSIAWTGLVNWFHESAVRLWGVC